MRARFTNIFESQYHHDCKYLNDKCKHNGLFIKTRGGQLKKYFQEQDVYDWEIHVYLHLVETKLCPLTTSHTMFLTYACEDYISLRVFLGKTNLQNAVLNEIYSFVKTFKHFKFIHGNLHIDNILINPQSMKFCVIDFSNSYITKGNAKPLYDRYPFINTKSVSCYQWDFITLYLSLQDFYKNDQNTLQYIDQLTLPYVPTINYIKNLDIKL
jgi:hypothetical protein